VLCFDEENQLLITGKPELGVVDVLLDLESSENEKIKNACNGALWTLRDALKKADAEKYKKKGEVMYLCLALIYHNTGKLMVETIPD
jgi:hypothetical protein